MSLPTVRPGDQRSGWVSTRALNRTVILVLLCTLTVLLLIARVSLHISFSKIGPARPVVPDIAKAAPSKKEHRLGDGMKWKELNPSEIGSGTVRGQRHRAPHRGAKVPKAENLPLAEPLSQPDEGQTVSSETP
ncbi:hypothetical protein FRB96_005047 [Tulasnella sp. 330]|nr:hypothetical protein FRB96_005047 [Tulasnella sp. 330]KAG8885769.1 hypothetical protein FRB97_009474 [Tulasnella sp. 331]